MCWKERAKKNLSSDLTSLQSSLINVTDLQKGKNYATNMVEKKQIIKEKVNRKCNKHFFFWGGETIAHPELVFKNHQKECSMFIHSNTCVCPLISE